MSSTVEFKRGEENLVLYYFTSRIVPFGKHNINSYNCGHCVIENITNLTSSDKLYQHFLTKTLNDNSNREDIISNIYPLEISFLENIRFKGSNLTEQYLYQRPYEAYVQELSTNEVTNVDDIKFHSFEIKIYDKIIDIWYFHVLLFWDTYTIQSKIRSNAKTFNTRRGIILVTEQPCFNFCFHLLKNLYNKTIKNPEGIYNMDKINRILSSLNQINVKRNRLNLISVSCDNNENIINEYPIAIRSHFRLIDINLFYLFKLFTLEDILFFLSCFRMKVNLVFISNDHDLLYPLHFLFANLFYPFTGDTDYAFYKTSPEFLFKKSLPKLFVYFYYMEDKTKFQTKVDNNHFKGNDSPFNYVSLQFENDKDVNQIGMIHLYRNKETKETIIKKEFYFKFGSLDAKDKQDITGKPDEINDNSIITRVLSFKNPIALDKMYNDIMKLINLGKDKEYDSFYGYEPKDNLIFMKISEAFLKLVCVFNDELVSELFLDASQLVLNVKLNHFEYEKDLLHEGIVINTYMDYKYFQVGNELSLFEMNSFYLKYRKKKFPSFLKIKFSDLKKDIINVIINTNDNSLQKIGEKKLTRKEYSQKEIDEETIFKICFSPYECFDFFVQNGLFHFKTPPTSNGFSNKDLGIALYCMIRSIFLINYLNPIPPFLYLINKENPLKVSKKEIQTLHNFLTNTKGFGIIIPPFTSIMYLYFYFNLYRQNCVKCNKCKDENHCISICKTCKYCVGCRKNNQSFCKDKAPQKAEEIQVQECVKCSCQKIYQKEIVPNYFPLINLDDISFDKNINYIPPKAANDEFFLPTISALLLFKEDVIKKTITHVDNCSAIKNIESQIAEICLFDKNEHFHYGVSQIICDDKTYEMECSICKEKLKLKIIESDGNEYIYDKIPTPNDIFLRVWEAIMSKQSIQFGKNLNEKNMYSYNEWQSDYRLIMFYGKLLYAEYGNSIKAGNFMKYVPPEKNSC